MVVGVLEGGGEGGEVVLGKGVGVGGKSGAGGVEGEGVGGVLRDLVGGHWWELIFFNFLGGVEIRVGGGVVGI